MATESSRQTVPFPDDDRAAADRGIRNAVAGHDERLVPADLGTTRWGAEHLARYLFAGHWAAGQRVADLCCGSGYGTSLLAACGAHSAAGFDLSSEVVSAAERRFGSPRVKFSTADVTAPLQLDEYHLRVCFEGLEHVRDAESLLINLRSALSDRGVVIVSTPNGGLYKSGHSGNPHHIHEYQLDEFRDLLSRHFRTVNLYFQWGYSDPFDFEWNPRNAMRALIPVGPKNALRSWRQRQPAERRDVLPHTDSEAGVPLGLAANYRPMPISYLSTALPGHRYGPPSFWIGVCKPA